MNKINNNAVKPMKKEYKAGLLTENFHRGVTTMKAKRAQKANKRSIFDRNEKNLI